VKPLELIRWRRRLLERRRRRAPQLPTGVICSGAMLKPLPFAVAVHWTPVSFTAQL
jgi:hypothetical protein